MKKRLIPISFVFCISLLTAQHSIAASTELMCKNKAKEIAAETYKNCVTEVKQTQVKSLRKEYEDKLSQLKNHYDKELRKLSSGQTTQKLESAKNSQDRPESIQSEKPGQFIRRSSGARELPASLDNNTDASTVEVVEIPAEQE